MPTVGAFHSCLIPFTNRLHHTARVARYSIALRYIPYRATLAFPNAPPNAGKAVFVSRSVLFRKNISARVNALPTVALAYTTHYLSVCAPVGAHFKSFICFVSHIPLNPHSQLFYPPKPRLRCSLNSHIFNWGAIAACCFARLRVAAG